MAFADRSRIVPRFWQGSVVAPGDPLYEAGFDVVALCAEEISDDPAYARVPFPGVLTLYSGIDDGALSRGEAEIAERTAAVLADQYRKGKRLLSICWQGRNRSGLVAALTLMRLYRCTGEQAIAQVQAMRKNALTNRSFREYLRHR